MADDALEKAELRASCGKKEVRATPDVPDHQLLRRIGEGAYGEVWLARNVMGTFRAVKVVYRDNFEDTRPYEREFTGIQKFEPISRSNEGLVDILQVGRNDQAGYFYYVMELADDAAPTTAVPDVRRLSSESEIRNPKIEIEQGLFSSAATYCPKTLGTELRQRGRLPYEECLQLGLSLSLALGHLHRHGLIHRDIKPSNIISVRGVPKLADIGLVTEVSEARSYVGTEGFIPPEGPNSAQADIYSLGKVLYEISMGKDRQEFPEPFTALADSPESEALLELNAVVLKACANEPHERYQSAEDMHVDLALLHSGRSVKRKRVVERRLALMTKLGAVTAILAVLATGGYLYQHQQTNEVKRLVRAESLQRQRAEEALNRLEMQRADELLAAGNSAAAVANLARIVRADPSHRMAAERLMSVLSQRRFPRPALAPLRHEGNVVYVGFSPDGHLVVTASWDKTARVLDVHTGQPLTEPLRHAEPLVSASFSPDGLRVVTTCLDLTARVWDVRTGQALIGPLMIRDQAFTSATIAALQKPPYAKGFRLAQASAFADFTTDGERLLTSCWGGTARVWDARTGRSSTEPPPRDNGLLCARFGADGQRVVTGSSDTTARVWDAFNGQPLTAPLPHPAEVYLAQFSPDGLWIVTVAGDKAVRVWDVRTGQRMNEPIKHEEQVLSAQFSPDGERVLTTSADNSARIWETRTGQPLSVALKHVATIYCAEFSADGLRVVTASEDKTARVWDAHTGEPLTEPLRHAERVNSARLSPDGQQVVTGCSDGTAWIWNVSVSTLLPDMLENQSDVIATWFSPDGHRVLTVAQDNTTRVRDVHTGELLTNEFKMVSGIHSNEFSPDGARVVIVAADKTARILDRRTRQPLTEPFKHDGPVTSVQFSPDGERIITASLDKTARVWDSHTGQPLMDPLKHDGQVNWASFSSDGRWAITASSDRRARIWELPFAPSPLPRWLPEMAEAVVGQRIDEHGVSESVSWDELMNLKQRLGESPESDSYTRWAKWFFAEPDRRTISASSSITVAEYVIRRTSENTRDSLQEAMRLSPTNGRAMGAMAGYLMPSDGARNPREAAEAAWYSRRALELDPEGKDAWGYRGMVLARNDNVAAALAAADRSLELDPMDHFSWHGKAWHLKKGNRFAESYQAYTKAIELAGSKPVMQAWYLFSRCYLLQLMGRFTEADSDFQMAKSIMAREEPTHLDLIRLCPHTNAPLSEIWQNKESDVLAELCSPSGPFAGAGLNARGIIQLSSRPLRRSSPQCEKEITGIKVNRRVHRIYFLHGSSGTAADGTQIGSFVLHFADAQSGPISILFGVGLGGFRTNLLSAKLNLPVAQKRPEPASGPEVRVYQSCWENIWPISELESIDFTSTMTEAAPFLIAIAVE